MSGTNNPTTAVTATGTALIDGVLLSEKWSESTIHYSLPTSAGVYDYQWRIPFVSIDFHEDLVDNFRAISSEQETAIDFALNAQYGPSAAAGFSVEGFTGLNIVKDTSPDTDSPEHLRFAGTTASSLETARVTDFPGGGAHGGAPIDDDDGDVWFGPNYGGYRDPEAGNYEWATHIHEIGHALGLKHGHERGGPGDTALPSDRDAMEYSIMSYNSYVGQTGDAYRNETWGYAQTFMMADIAALQHMYGADYTTNSGDTIYSWRPWSGDTLVNGRVAIDPGGNRIFATIWDGGGRDTYDLSAYSTGVEIDLDPGASSLFSAAQQANLGDGNSAAGNIYNALLHRGDARSLIEDAIGGWGDDRILGNRAANTLTGGGGADALQGRDGNDSFRYVDGLSRSSGSDNIAGGSGHDRILLEGAGRFDLRGLNVSSVEEIEFAYRSGEDKTLVLSSKELDQSHELTTVKIDGNAGGRDVVEALTDSVADVDLSGWTFQDWGAGDAIVLTGDGRDNDLVGTSRADTIEGGGGGDALAGGAGDDAFVYGATVRADGADVVSGGAGRDRLLMEGAGIRDLTAIDVTGVEVIEFAQERGVDRTLILSNKELDQAHELETALIDGNIYYGTSDVIRVEADFTSDVDLSGWTFRDWGHDDEIVVEGSGRANALTGSSQADRLIGGGGADVLTGGGGADRLVGGTGGDTFRFEDAAHSGVRVRDVIEGFDVGGFWEDVIDLSGIDAVAGTWWDDAFSFWGVQSRADGLSKGAGALWVEDSGDDTLVSGNVDGDDAIEFTLLIEDGTIGADQYGLDHFLV